MKAPHDLADPAPVIRFSGAIFDGPAGKIQSLDGECNLAKPNYEERCGGVAFCK